MTTAPETSDDVIRRLHERKPMRSLASVSWQWSMIVLAAAAAAASRRWYVYFASAIVIAGRQHALLVLMHDGAHGLLHPRRQINDLLSDVLLSFPLFVSTRAYRAHHFQHHRHLNTADDPDLDLDTPSWSAQRWARALVLDLTGLGTLRTLRSASSFSPFRVQGQGARRYKIGFLAYTTGLVAALVWSGLWATYLLLWLLPMATVLTHTLRLRAVAEHGGCELSAGSAGVRTVVPLLFERALLAPCNVGYHGAHHRYPAVPFFALPQLHAALVRRGTPWGRMAAGYLCGARSMRVDLMSRTRRPGARSGAP